MTRLVNHRPVRRCRYAYYEGAHAGGSTGDLASATVEGWDPGLGRWFNLSTQAR